MNELRWQSKLGVPIEIVGRSQRKILGAGCARSEEHGEPLR